MSEFMERRKRLEERAEAIQNIEIRIGELKKALKITSDMRLKMCMQETLRANKNMLEYLKDCYWRDEL